MSFNLPEFLPYLLNQAAEAASREFQAHYRQHYGMLRTEWRVLFHLGLYGDLTARQICDMASLHKTKVSRAVSALEEKRFLTRRPHAADRRVEQLSLTASGQRVFADLSAAAESYEARLISTLPETDIGQLKTVLRALVQTGSDP
jgi:DNA-binding MarR family transcriptional regulator